MNVAEKAIREHNARAERWDILDAAGFSCDVADDLKDHLEGLRIKRGLDPVGDIHYIQSATLVEEYSPFEDLGDGPLKLVVENQMGEGPIILEAKLMGIEIWRVGRFFDTDHGPVFLEFFVTEFEYEWGAW